MNIALIISTISLCVALYLEVKARIRRQKEYLGFLQNHRLSLFHFNGAWSVMGENHLAVAGFHETPEAALAAAMEAKTHG